MLYIFSFILEVALQQKKATKSKIDVAAKNEEKLLIYNVYTIFHFTFFLLLSIYEATFAILYDCLLVYL